MENQIMKHCITCGQSKPLTESFYRAGRFFQTNCKPCHNQLRKKWKLTSTYVKRPKKPHGFLALPIETQALIKHELEELIPLTHIAKHHNINYTTFIHWKKTGQFTKEKITA